MLYLLLGLLLYYPSHEVSGSVTSIRLIVIDWIRFELSFAVGIFLLSFGLSLYLGSFRVMIMQ